MMLESLEALNNRLLQAPSLRDKIGIIDHFSSSDNESLPSDVLSLEAQFVLKQLIAIGQGGQLHDLEQTRRDELIERLLLIDHFYRELGGLIGYQIEILRRLKKGPDPSFEGATFHSPHFHDITREGKELQRAILDGLEALPQTAEFYPLGGAADRLHLIDEETGEELPAAKLHFAERSLLAGLIRDLEAREYLYFKVFGRSIHTPICVMTSPEKGNHEHIMAICEEHRWFGRPKELFRFFSQPLVPAVDAQGNWLWRGAGRPVLKPGGHGAIWKLARDEGVFQWLQSLGVTHALVRQINNPLAGLDYGLLAFLGLGVAHKRVFGFVSCPRLIKAAEGVNVLVEKKKGDRCERVLTNIEYCDFSRFGIEDAPLKEGEPYSRFTSNTNILFAHLPSIHEAVDKCPFPGLLINLKKGSYQLENGEKREEMMARLESTMQNIADVFIEEGSAEIRETKKTFITYNHRGKTISAAKKAYLPGGPLQETPEHCFFDLLRASYELLRDECHFQLPNQRTLEEMLALGPECAFLYYPALGPLYSIISQKIRGGKIALGSEMRLELADLDLEELELEGSLQIVAEQPLAGRCTLHRVKVCNRGVDWASSKPFWRGRWSRVESAKIILKGNSEFIVEGALLSGDQTWIVEEGTRMIVQKEGVVKIETLPIDQSPFWDYLIDPSSEISLRRRSSYYHHAEN